MDPFLPLSLSNPEHPAPLSPLALLSRRPASTSHALQQLNRSLASRLDKMRAELSFRQAKNESLTCEVEKQHKKIRSWKNCYDKAQEEYCYKKQRAQQLEQHLAHLKSLLKQSTNCTPKRMACDEDDDEHIAYEERKSIENMGQQRGNKAAYIEDSGEATPEDSFNISRRFSGQIFMGNMAKLNRVNSIALERRKSKKRQALSLTHLHRNRENERLYE